MNLDERPRSERIMVASIAAMLLTLPPAHAAAYLLERALGQVPAGSASFGLSLAVIAILCATALAAARSRGLLRPGLAAVAVAGLALAELGRSAPGASWTLLAIALAAAPLLSCVARRLPRRLDGLAARRPLLALAWLLLGLGSALQTGRLAAFVSDPGLPYGPVLPDYFDQHTCLAAYLQAAELDAKGEANVYDVRHYPGLDRDAAPTTEVVGMQPYLEDPYQYPPPFLLLPKLGLWLSNDYGVLRVGNFALSALLFLGTALALARWIGGRRGLVAGLAIPLVWTSVPTMLGLQYGQFHLASLCLSMLAMLAFERGRRATGGALLAAAITSKLFPVALLLVLLVRRQKQAVVWTLAYLSLFALSGLVFLGPDTYGAFLQYQLPRLLSGEAFAFHEAWPELAALLAAANQSPLGLVQKLGQLGIATPAGAVGLLNGLHSLALVGAILLFAGRASSPAAQARLWIGLLLLASMRSGGAWADYIMTAGLWTLSFWALELRATRLGRLALSVSAALLFFLPGIVPLPSLPSVPLMMSLSLLGYLAALWVGFGGVASVASARVQASERALRAAPSAS